MRILFVAFATLSIFANSAPVEDRLAALEAAVRQLQQQVTAKDGKINSLTEQLAHYQEEEQEDHAHCEHAAHGVAEENHDYHAGHGEEQVTVSGVLNVAVGGGDEAQSVMEKLQAGAHDPRKRGFNLQQFELAVNGKVGPLRGPELCHLPRGWRRARRSVRHHRGLAILTSSLATSSLSLAGSTQGIWKPGTFWTNPWSTAGCLAAKEPAVRGCVWAGTDSRSPRRIPMIRH